MAYKLPCQRHLQECVHKWYSRIILISIWRFLRRFQHYLEHTLDYIQRVLTDRSTYCSHGLNDPKFQVVPTGYGLVYCAPLRAPLLTLERRQKSQYYLKESKVTGLEDGMVLGMQHQLLHGHSLTIPPHHLNGGLTTRDVIVQIIAFILNVYPLTSTYYPLAHHSPKAPFKTLNSLVCILRVYSHRRHERGLIAQHPKVGST